MLGAIAGDMIGCIGVSETTAGSDVAGLKTAARKDGDDYVINGHKMWITNSPQADFICLLANTSDDKPHVNKSMIIDLPVDAQEVIVSQPGVANAILRNKRRAVIQAVSSGDTNIFFLDGAGRTIVVVDVSTTGAMNTGGSNVAAVLRETYSKIMPNSDIQVEAVTLTKPIDFFPA